ncbi:NIN-like protein, partial [Tanacetum coccineum]
IPIDEAAKSLGVSRSTLKRFCRDNNMTSWPLPKHNKKTARTDSKLSQTSRSKQNLQQSSNVRFGLFGVVILLVRVKRWSCASKHHGFSGNWWSCGKHSHLSFKSDSIYQVARLMVFLKRWKNKKSTRHATQKRDHLESTEKPLNKLNVDRKLPDPNLIDASPKQIKSNEVSDTRKVTVKATFKDDMIKVQIPISSRLFELQNEVAHRTKLKSTGFRLKYKDEDDDLILLACDADLQNLLGGRDLENQDEQTLQAGLQSIFATLSYDILIIGKNIPVLQDVKSYIRRCFAMKDLGEAAYILGIKIYRDRSKRLIGLCQSAYIEKILKRFFMENSKRGSIPMQEKLKLSKSQGASTPAEVKRMQNVPYALAVGSIIYVVRCTRPEVAFA